MKYRDIAHWKYDDSTMRNLAIFANLIDELTFCYTTDTFKAPALNVLSMIEEALAVMNDIRAGVIYEGAFQSVYEEMKALIAKDPVFIDLLKKKNMSYIISELDDQKCENKIYNALNIIVTLNLHSDYYALLREYIIGFVKENSKERNLLVLYTRILLTQLRNMGYTDDFIYYTNRRFFYHKRSIIENVDAIDDFFSKLDGTPKHYTISFIGNSDFRDINPMLRLRNISVSDDLDYGHLVAYERFLKYRSKNSVIISIEIEALDAFAARVYALESINTFVRFYSYYHHKTILKVRECCLAKCMDNGSCYTISKPIRNIVKCKDLRKNVAAEMFKKFFSSVDFNRDSTLRIVNSLEQHKSALESENLENQYINLFTALEILIPKDPTSDKQRISQIHNVLVPYLSISYFKKLLQSILKSLYVWDKIKTAYFLKMVTEGETEYEKLAALLTLAKYNGDIQQSNNPLPALKRELFDCNHHLMLNRLDFVAKILHKHESILEFLKIHMQRIKWHIDRIYRTRNLIVHAGTSPAYMGTLLENIHSYYDILVGQLFDDNIELNFKDIQMSYNSCSLRLNAYVKYLQEQKKEYLDEDSFLKAIFFK